jgi:carboxyl-terminal processing protease
MITRRLQHTGFVLGFVAGSVLTGVLTAMTRPAHAEDNDAAYKPLRVFAQVLSYIQQSYVEPVDTTNVVYNGVNGLLAGLDPYSTFLRPSDYERLREDTAGEFGGLGIEVNTDQSGDSPAAIVISTVHDDSPAANAGLRSGDLIIMVDGEDVRGAPLEGTVRLMRGVPGTKVMLRVERAGWKQPRDIPLIRREVIVPSVRSERLPGAAGDVAYVAVKVFQDRTDADVGRALRSLRAEAAKQQRSIVGVVLDLRGNPGGLLDEGVKLADRFLSDGIIVTTEGRDPSASSIERAHRDGTEPNDPIVVLVDGGTASASEIVAGALQDHRRAELVGEPTFGKGSVQTLFGLDDGAGLKLTVARYKTPSGRSIQGKGIVPDVSVRGSRSPSQQWHGAERIAHDPVLAAGLSRLGQIGRR